METLPKVFVVLFWITVVQTAPRQKRLTLAEYKPSYYYSNIGGNPNVYAFGYDVSDPATGNSQFRSEQRHPNGTVTGNYGYIDPAGAPRKYKYIADERGYRVYRDRPSPPPLIKPHFGIEYMEPSVSWTRPPKKPKKNKSTIANNFVSNLGRLFSDSYV